MSCYILTVARKAKLETASDKLVLMLLADNANDDGACWPNQETLAAECGCSERNIRKIITRLEEFGLLIKQSRGRTRGIMYQLCIGNIKKIDYRNGTTVPVTPEPQFQKNDTHRNHSSGNTGTTVPVYKNHHRTKTLPTLSAPSPRPDLKKQKALTHSWFVRWWCHAYQQIIGEKYAFTKKDAGQVKQLLDLLGLGEIVARSCVYLSLSPQQRFPRGSPTIGGLLCQINEVSHLDDATVDKYIKAGLLPKTGTKLISHQPWGTQ